MANPFKSPSSTSLGLMLARLPLGALFCIAGYRKLAGIGAAKFVSENIKLVPKYMPPWFPKVYLNALPYAEMALGVFIVIGLLTRVSGFLTSCLLISFLIVYGVHDNTGANLPFNPNFFYLGTALLLLLAGGGGIGVDAKLFGRTNAGSGKH